MELTTTTLAVDAIVGVAIPALVGLAAREHAAKWLLATLNLGLSAATGTATTLATSTHVDWRALVISFAATWVMSIGTHFGFLKPSGASDALLRAGGVVGSGAASPAPEPTPPAQPDEDPVLVAADEPPADPPPPMRDPPVARAPASLGLGSPPAYLQTPAGRATVRAATRTAAKPPAAKRAPAKRTGRRRG